MSTSTQPQTFSLTLTAEQYKAISSSDSDFTPVRFVTHHNSVLNQMTVPAACNIIRNGKSINAAVKLGTERNIGNIALRKTPAGNQLSPKRASFLAAYKICSTILAHQQNNTLGSIDPIALSGINPLAEAHGIKKPDVVDSNTWTQLVLYWACVPGFEFLAGWLPWVCLPLAEYKINYAQELRLINQDGEPQGEAEIMGPIARQTIHGVAIEEALAEYPNFAQLNKSIVDYLMDCTPGGGALAARANALRNTYLTQTGMSAPTPPPVMPSGSTQPPLLLSPKKEKKSGSTFSFRKKK